MDGYFRRDNGEQSQLTFMVYLNDNFAAGWTYFYQDDLTLRFSVRPEQGMALVFAHQQRHEGPTVETGRKYVFRCDIMYAKRDKGSAS